jgi:hypothetical protein
LVFGLQCSRSDAVHDHEVGEDEFFAELRKLFGRLRAEAVEDDDQPTGASRMIANRRVILRG